MQYWNNHNASIRGNSRKIGIGLSSGIRKIEEYFKKYTLQEFSHSRKFEEENWRSK